MLRNCYVFHFGTATKDLDRFLKLTSHQKSVLESSFAIHCYPNATTIKELAQQTMLGEKKVFTWFARRRHYIRKGISEGTLSSCEYLYVYLLMIEIQYYYVVYK